MKVLLVDDHQLVRHGLAHVVSEVFPDSEVVEAADAPEAMAALEAGDVDIGLFDVRLPGKDGIELLKDAKVRWPELPVIMLTTYDHAKYARQALAEGASGYMLKDASPADLAQAMSVALAGGGNVLSSKVIQNLFDESEVPAPGIHHQHGPMTADDMTHREREILELLISGQSNREIAGHLFLSEKTVKAHLAAIFRKLGVNNRTQAAMIAVSMGIGGGDTPAPDGETQGTGTGT